MLKELWNEMYGRISRPFYRLYFYRHLASFKNYKKFLNIGLKDELATKKLCDRYKNEKKECPNKHCYIPCKKNTIDFDDLQKYVTDDELMDIYKSLLKNFKYDNQKYINAGRMATTSWNRYILITGKMQYVDNCEFLYADSYRLMDKIRKEKMKQEEKLKLEQLLEEENSKKSCCKVEIVGVEKFDNNGKLKPRCIRIKMKMDETNEFFYDYLNDSDSELELFKIARLEITLGVTEFMYIFDYEYKLFKDFIMGKELYIDVIKENGLIKVDLYKGSIYYKISEIEENKV